MLTGDRHIELEHATIGPGSHDSGHDTEADAQCSTDGPMRKCIATGEVRPKDELIRFVIAPDGTVTPDIAGKLPGRGLWVAAGRDALDQACKRKAFSRAARRQVDIPRDLTDRVEGLLARRCIDLLSLARRAGEAVTGFEKAGAALKSGKAAIYVSAKDAGLDGVGKLDRQRGGAVHVDCLAREELGRAFGRDDAVHCVLMRGGLSGAFLHEAKRLSGFRTAGTPVEIDPTGGEGK